MVAIPIILVLLAALSAAQLIALYWFRAILHHWTYRILAMSQIFVCLFLLVTAGMLQTGHYHQIPVALQLLNLFCMIILPICLFLSTAGSIIYAAIRPKFPYIFTGYMEHVQYYVTVTQRSRNGLLKQVGIQWADNIVVTIPVVERIVQAKHGKFRFETYRIEGRDSLLLRLDGTSSNHYVYFPKHTHESIQAYVQVERGQRDIQKQIQTEHMLQNEGIMNKIIVVDTFVLFDYPDLLPIIEKENHIILSKKVFESFPYHKVRQPQFRRSLSIVYNAFSGSQHIQFGGLEISTSDEEVDEVDRLIAIALTEMEKSDSVVMLTTNNKLKLKCRHFQVPVIDANRLLKMFNSASNPIIEVAYLPVQTTG